MSDTAKRAPAKTVTALRQDDSAQEQYLRIAERWSAVTPPVRPTAEDLACFEQALLDARLGRGAPALILGSTAELRSLAHKHGLATTCCDVDKDVWIAVSGLRTVVGEETFIHGNWLDLTPSPRYDLILGDCSLNMLTLEEIEVLVPRLEALLNPGGVCLQRINVRNESLTLDSIRQAIHSYRSDGCAVPLFAYLVFLGESLRNEHHPEMTMRQFLESFVYPHLTPDELAPMKPMAIDWSFGYPRPRDMMALLKRHFAVTNVQKSAGPGTWDTTSIYTLKKRAQ
jgi:hypothetical protein